MHVNNDFQRNSNISHVFETVWKNKEISRIDISRKLELYRSTVSNIISTLLSNNVIIEGEQGAATEKGGRKPVFLSVNKNFGSVLGIELQPDYFIVSALAFNGEPFFTMKAETPFNPSYVDKPDEMFVYVIDKIIEAVLPVVADFPMPLLGVCFAIPGIVDGDSGVIIRSDPFNLRNFSYAEKLGKRYGITLFVENDAKCCGWLHSALDNNFFQNDFICVLAKNLSGIDKFKAIGTYKKGIGIGLSISTGGRIINGSNYAVGEYLSSSWRKSNKGQTGLPEDVSSSLNTNDDSYKKWVIDLFSTLTITIPLLEPNYVYFHGQPNVKRDIIYSIIHDNVSQFEAVLERYNSKLVFMDEDQYEIGRGAAMMFIHKLFRLPYIEKERSYSSLNWDSLFSIQKEALRNQLIHKAK